VHGTGKEQAQTGSARRASPSAHAAGRAPFAPSPPQARGYTRTCGGVHQISGSSKGRDWLVSVRQRAAHRDVAPLLLMHLRIAAGAFREHVRVRAHVCGCRPSVSVYVRACVRACTCAHRNADDCMLAYVFAGWSPPALWRMTLVDVPTLRPMHTDPRTHVSMGAPKVQRHGPLQRRSHPQHCHTAHHSSTRPCK